MVQKDDGYSIETNSTRIVATRIMLYYMYNQVFNLMNTGAYLIIQYCLDAYFI